MPGFSTNASDSQQVLYADNVDFSGGSPVAPKVSTNGQLLIGHTASPHIKVGTLTSPNSSIDIGYSDPNITVQVSATGDKHVAKFIVSSETGVGGQYTTISSAIAAAQGTGIASTIFIMPGLTGTYTENFTLPANINLTAFDCDADTPNVTIIGKITCTDAGSRSISGIRLQTNSDFFLVVSGAAATVVNMTECFLNCSNNTGISFTSASASALIFIRRCEGDILTTGISYFASSSAGILRMQFCSLSNSGNSLLSSTISAGSLFMEWVRGLFPITSSGTGSLILKYFNFVTNATNATILTVGGSGGSELRFGFLDSGTGSAISISDLLTLTSSTIKSSNANVITGAGSLAFSNVDFPLASTINVTTQGAFVSSNDCVKVTTPGAYPYTTVPQDYLILVDTSQARTIIPRAGPLSGEKYVIKDSTGTAAAFNITVTPSGKNIDGAASFVINTNRGSITIIYNGTEWSVN